MPCARRKLGGRQSALIQRHGRAQRIDPAQGRIAHPRAQISFGLDNKVNQLSPLRNLPPRVIRVERERCR